MKFIRLWYVDFRNVHSVSMWHDGIRSEEKLFKDNQTGHEELNEFVKSPWVANISIERVEHISWEKL